MIASVTCPALSHFRSVFISGTPSHLLLNDQLESRQIKFLLAREIGYQVMGLAERSPTSSPDRAISFEQVLNDFKASYFAGALSMPATPMLADLEIFHGSAGLGPATPLCHARPLSGHFGNAALPL